MQSFELLYNYAPVGRVLIRQQGLYYNIRCSILIKDFDRPHLIAVSENGGVDLAACSQNDSGFSIERILPVKYVGLNLRQFYIQPDNAGSVCNIFENKPFLFIEKLDNAVLRRRGKNVVIEFK